MINPVILKRSKELGLNKYETKSYLALLERETLSVTEIAKLAKIPRPATYEALENLLAKGFCIAKPGKVRQYSAVDPELIKEKALAELDDEFDDKLSEIETKRDELLVQKESSRTRLLDLYKEISPIYKNGRSNDTPINYIEIVKDWAALRNKLLELIKNTKKEALFFVKPPFLTRPPGRHYDPSKSKPFKLQADIISKIIMEIPKDKEEIKLWCERIDEDPMVAKYTRLVEKVPMKMQIYDERTVMMYFKDPVAADDSYTIQIVEQPELAKTMKLAFEKLWEQAEDSSLLKKLLKEGSK